MNARRSIWIILFALCFISTRAQQDNYINLNNRNGLPSNHVYSVIKDGHGYMWMATMKGVVQYNGYTFRTYTTADGLPQDDVWGLHCDKKGRIWLRSIARKMGYIYNNSYHNVYVKDIDRLFYPSHISDYDSGILFTTKTDADVELMVEKHDTIINYCSLGSGNFVCCDNMLWTIDIYAVSRQWYSDKDKLRPVSYCRFNFPSGKNASTLINTFKQYIFWYRPGHNFLLLGNTETCDAREIRFSEDIQFADYDAHSLFVFTNNYIYKIDTTARLVGQYRLKDLPGAGGGQITGTVTNCFEDSFWGRWITTSTSGAWVQPGQQRNMHQSAVDLEGYRLAGIVSDSISYWWNKSSKTLLRLDHAGRQLRRHYPGIHDLRAIVRWNAREVLFFGFDLAYILDHETGWLRRLSIPVQRLVSDVDSTEVMGRMTSLRQALALGDSNTILVARGGGAFRFRVRHDTFFSQSLFTQRIESAAYDRLRRGLWIYEEFSIRFQPDSGKQVYITNRMLDMMGLRGIKKIATDSYGNLFVKDNKQMYVIDMAGHSKRSLFTGYNLKDMGCDVNSGYIILTGKAGMLLSKIKGRYSFSDPVFYPNAKNNLYQEVKDVAVLKNKVIVGTDKHTYEVAIPPDSEFYAGNTWQPEFKALIYYDGKAVSLEERPQIAIDQEHPLLQFDVINPAGNGLLLYTYKFEDSTWRQLAAQELYLPNLKPGRQYRLWLKVYDDIWRSRPIPFTVFVQPYWYQTGLWTTIFIVVGILAIAALMVVVIIVTRYYAARGEEKKRSLIQLELRAIYSQLNPHFIFNTLNSATYFIRKGMYDAALEHINKFAILLRSYLGSTRNRQILLSDEVKNLRSYIELQQVRFAYKFRYRIAVEDGLEYSRVCVPSLLIQPFVENAINHGLVPKDDPGNLYIRFRKGATGKEIICTISDDGIGRQQSAKDKMAMPPGKQSYGDHMITELVDILNKYERAEITIEYIDNKPPDTGTVVIITIKNPLYE